MNLTTRQLGSLDCRIVDALPEGTSPRLVIVLCHGFGAPGDDLVPLAPELIAGDATIAGGTRFFFPAAPLSLDERGIYGGRAWWPLDIESSLVAFQQGRFDYLRDKEPPGLPEAREKLTALCDEILSASQLGSDRLVLGGFSQGAVTALDTALGRTHRPGGLVLYSATLMCEDRWRESAGLQPGPPVVQSHGRYDPLLPFVAAEWLRDLLTASNWPVEFLPFDGDHTIPRQALTQTKSLLKRLLDETAE